MTVSINFKENLKPPIYKNDQIGTCTVYLENEKIRTYSVVVEGEIKE